MLAMKNVCAIKWMLLVLTVVVSACAEGRPPAGGRERGTMMARLVEDATKYATGTGRQVDASTGAATYFASWAALQKDYAGLLPGEARATVGGRPFWLVVFQQPTGGSVFVLLGSDGGDPEPVFAGRWID
jgi:hypothetical protein